MTKITILLGLFSTVVFSQNISGTLYDAEAPVSGANIMNISSKSITSSDGRGRFIIYGEVNDTLVFTSLFHHNLRVMVTESHLKGSQVFELKKMVHQLDVVEVHGAFKLMNEEKETSRVNKQFKTDVEKNPHLYRRPNTNSGPIDFIEIGRRVAKLFRRKNPPATEPIDRFITSDDLNTLFMADEVLNDKFLVLDLNITKDFISLFFVYCETKHISTSFLRPDQRIYLVDQLLEVSDEFREILKESRKP